MQWKIEENWSYIFDKIDFLGQLRMHLSMKKRFAHFDIRLLRHSQVLLRKLIQRKLDGIFVFIVIGQCTVAIFNRDESRKRFSDLRKISTFSI